MFPSLIDKNILYLMKEQEWSWYIWWDNQVNIKILDDRYELEQAYTPYEIEKFQTYYLFVVFPRWTEASMACLTFFEGLLMK